MNSPESHVNVPKQQEGSKEKVPSLQQEDIRKIREARMRSMTERKSAIPQEIKNLEGTIQELKDGIGIPPANRDMSKPSSVVTLKEEQKRLDVEISTISEQNIISESPVMDKAQPEKTVEVKEQTPEEIEQLLQEELSRNISYGNFASNFRHEALGGYGVTIGEKTYAESGGTVFDAKTYAPVKDQNILDAFREKIKEVDEKALRAYERQEPKLVESIRTRLEIQQIVHTLEQADPVFRQFAKERILKDLKDIADNDTFKKIEKEGLAAGLEFLIGRLKENRDIQGNKGTEAGQVAYVGRFETTGSDVERMLMERYKDFSIKGILASLKSKFEQQQKVIGEDALTSDEQEIEVSNMTKPMDQLNEIRRRGLEEMARTLVGDEMVNEASQAATEQVTQQEDKERTKEEQARALFKELVNSEELNTLKEIIQVIRPDQATYLQEAQNYFGQDNVPLEELKSSFEEFGQYVGNLSDHYASMETRDIYQACINLDTQNTAIKKRIAEIEV